MTSGFYVINTKVLHLSDELFQITFKHFVLVSFPFTVPCTVACRRFYFAML